jgi:hypothetical protein
MVEMIASVGSGTRRASTTPAPPTGRPSMGPRACRGRHKYALLYAFQSEVPCVVGVATAMLDRGPIYLERHAC